jgi:hypothetical protein
LKTWLFAVCILLAGAFSAFAEDPSYEANAGLISPGVFILFYNSQGPLSYNESGLKDLPKDIVHLGKVKSKSCQYGLSLPTFISFPPSISGALGNGSFKKAVQNMQQASPQLDGIYDVKVDVHEITILTIFGRECTEITAQGFRIRTDTRP